MSSNLNPGTKVKWKWGTGWGTGTIKEKFVEEVTKNLGGTEVTRKASTDEPAYLIEQADGATVLKSHSEIQANN